MKALRRFVKRLTVPCSDAKTTTACATNWYCT
jgi:hypothetical protein